MRNTGIIILFLLFFKDIQATWSASSPNVMYYWGQNSASGSDTQMPLATYCQSGKVDAVILSFLNIFNVGGLPGLNLANACTTTFPGQTLLDCPSVGKDIRVCQSLGIKVILSLGGAAGSYGFTSDTQGQTFAQTLWDLFGGGISSSRPFGNVTIDGIDLDIEGGPSIGYSSLVTAARFKFGSSFLVGAAPQCPFPDAILGSVIDSSDFDYVNVQFYNNYCSAAGNTFNFGTWANWATQTSPNKSVKVYLTLPASESAAGSGYVPISTIQTIVPQITSEYPGVYGGVSIWDASQAFSNGNFASQLYTLVKNSNNMPAYTSTSISNTATSTTLAATTTLDTVIITSNSTNTTTKKATVTISNAATTTVASTTQTPCVTANQGCSIQGQYICTSNGAYAVCANSKWVVTSCPPGTSCISTSDGSSIYCGYVSNSSTCSTVNSVKLTDIVLNKGGAIPISYKASQVQAQLNVIKANASSFEVVVNAHRIGLTPFSSSVTACFSSSSNVKFASVENGQVRQAANDVCVNMTNTYNSSMSIVFPISGSINSGVFVAPSPDSLRFS